MPTNLLPEIVARSQSGKFFAEKDYEMALSRKVAELVNKYEIKFNPKELVPSDNAMADRLWQAGLELFLDLGVYNMSTSRVIQFSREEVEEVLSHLPSQLVLGEGRDAVAMKARRVEDTEPPIVHSGPTGTPCSEEYHPKILQSCAQEPLVDCLGAGSVSTYFGQEILPGTPLEILGAKRDAMVARQAITNAGRPGMHINDVAVPLTAAGKFAALDPERGLRPCDGVLVSQMAELKTNWDQLSRVAYLVDHGVHVVDLMCPLIGGLGGGAPGTAVVSVASHLLGAVCYKASYHMLSHTHLKYCNNTDPLGLWIQAMVGQALARNTKMLLLNDIYCVSGPGTEELLYEVAAGALVGTTSGMNMQGAGCTGGFERDHTTGLEARFIGEVSRAATGLTRQEANELVLKCLARYKDTFETPKRGEHFKDVYDPVTIRPRSNWLSIYDRVKNEVAKMGLHFVT